VDVLIGEGVLKKVNNLLLALSPAAHVVMGSALEGGLTP
jgi:hypothetical protein